MTKYKISVRTLQGVPLTFTVSSYQIVEGDFVEFIDERSPERKKLKFHASNCEIAEVPNA